MSTNAKKTAAGKAAKETKPEAASKAPEATEQAPSQRETRLRCTVIRPEGTKFRNMNLGYGWSGPEGLPEKEARELEKLGHIRIDGIAG